jgi:hypothetical protein
MFVGELPLNPPFLVVNLRFCWDMSAAFSSKISLEKRRLKASLG